jgi:uncharacterized cupin superfamily protein
MTSHSVLLIGDQVLEPDPTEGRPLRGIPGGRLVTSLENRGDDDAVILEVGDRGASEEVVFSRDGVRAILDSDGGWIFTREQSLQP